MPAHVILLVVALVLIVAALRNLVRHGWRLTIAARTWLIVAAIFIAVTIFTRWRAVHP